MQEEKEQRSLCTIPRLTELSQATFESEYRDKKPFVLVSSEHRARNVDFYEATRLDTLKRTHGGRLMKTTTSESSTSSLGQYITFAEYSDSIEGVRVTVDMAPQDTPYFFGDYDDDQWQDLLDQYSEPELMHSPTEVRRLSFGAGPDLSGTPFHFHGPGWAEVLHGRKRWFMYEKDAEIPAIDRSLSTLQWVVQEYPQLANTTDRPLECVLEQGELIYFPSMAWHSTLNLGSGVFLSTFVNYQRDKTDL
jgi:hypothetical protein